MATIDYILRGRMNEGKTVEITEDNFYYLLGVLPPIYAEGCYGISEAYDDDGEGRARRTWFTSQRGRYFLTFGVRGEAERIMRDPPAHLPTLRGNLVRATQKRGLQLGPGRPYRRQKGEKAMQLRGTSIVTLEVGANDVGHGLIAEVARRLSVKDDAGCDWKTDGEGRTYIGSKDWCVSEGEHIATLVDAANILIYGNRVDVND